MKRILYVGLDVHKESVTIATGMGASTFNGGIPEEVRLVGSIPNTSTAIDNAIRKLVSTGAQPVFAYEAGPSGYSLYRYLLKKGFSCTVIAPSLIPRKPGDKIKTDGRDAIMLTRLLRAGELTKVHVPSEEDEAIRDLFRTRCDAKNMERKAKQYLLSFLLRLGTIYPGVTNWTKTHYTWLDALSLPQPAHQLALQEYIDTVKQCYARVQRLDSMLQQVAQNWSGLPLVRALQSFRGISFLSAIGLASELGDLRRFSNPRQLMSYVGLVPSENSSGATTRRGALTKMGNAHVRWLLVEAAWSYRLKARKSIDLLRRQKDIPQELLDVSWKAQVRLCGRYQRLIFRGKPKNKVIASVARELAGFIWAIGQMPATAREKDISQ